MVSFSLLSCYVQTQVRYLFITPRSWTGSKKIISSKSSLFFFWSLTGLGFIWCIWCWKLMECNRSLQAVNMHEANARNYNQIFEEEVSQFFEWSASLPTSKPEYSQSGWVSFRVARWPVFYCYRSRGRYEADILKTSALSRYFKINNLQ